MVVPWTLDKTLPGRVLILALWLQSPLVWSRKMRPNWTVPMQWMEMSVVHSIVNLKISDWQFCWVYLLVWSVKVVYHCPSLFPSHARPAIIISATTEELSAVTRPDIDITYSQGAHCSASNILQVRTQAGGRKTDWPGVSELLIVCRVWRGRGRAVVCLTFSHS